MRVAIIHYDDALSPGGINTNIRETFQGLLRKGVDAHIIQPKSKVEDKIRNHSNFHELVSPKLSPPLNLSPALIRSLKDTIRQIDPDIIHVHSHMNLLSHSIIRSLSKNFPIIPIVFSPHLDVAISSRFARPLFSLFNRTLGRKTLSRVSSIIFNSQFEMKAYEKSVMNVRIPFRIIPPGIFSTGTMSNKKWESDLTILYFGHFVRRKRVDRIISMFRSLLDSPLFEGVNLRLEICGSGPEEKNLHNLSESLGLENNIAWMPFLNREKLVEKIQNVNYFALLSDSEAYAISVAESLSLGTPVIGSNLAALSEYHSTPGAFLFDNPEDYEEISRVIAEHRGMEIVIGPTGGNISSNQQSLESHFELYSSVKS